MTREERLEYGRTWRETNRELIRQKDRERYHSDPRRREYCIASAKKTHLRTNYGLTQEAFDEMVKAQNNQCACCGRPLPPASYDRRRSAYVDHDHKTGKVRGIVDARCNTMLGGLESPDRAAGEAYLRKHSS